ncbi:hypothetical protein MUBE_13895 [Mycobacterium uberis]|uniref:Uncharacterized protein n=1 Tax=Mycobacterium uberis TaxID=2162698 RepID=A0A3E1HD71_9MYCO|nr:hypothetical protein [Mycobacterium uberis]RFD24346.1 hypothetical protein MUBE_13895 [Mycobacterium uberis]
MSHIFLAVIVDGSPQHHGPDFGKASPMGLLVVLLLLVATLLLLQSMNRQLKRVPTSFDPEHPEPGQAADEGTYLGVDVGEEPLSAGRNGSAQPPEPDKDPG